MIIGIEATKAFESKKTGIGWYCFYIIRELIKLVDDDKLRLYVNPWLNVKTQMPAHLSTCTTDRLEVKTLRWPCRFGWTQVRLSFEMLTDSPDVLFIPSHLPPLYHPKRLVVTVHDLAFKQYPQVYSKRELILQRWGIRRVLKRAWRIIVPSEFTYKEIKRYYPDLAGDNVYVVPHGIDFQMQNVGSKMQRDDLKFKILYIGRIEAKKNIANLIKAFDIIKSSRPRILDCELILIGGPGFGYTKIKAEINSSPYKESIKELGWQDKGAISDYLRQSAVFVLPSFYEGFGLPILEAMALGAPIACSSIPALREIGGDIPLYFDPNDPKDIADKISQLITDRYLSQQKVQAGIDWAGKLTWKRSAEKTLNVLTGKF